MNKYLTGRIKFYDTTKGFGFIKADTTNKKYFFHMDHVTGSMVLSRGDAVIFDEKETNRGIHAINVTKL